MKQDLSVGSIRIVIGDAHIYENHMGVAAIQIQRKPFGLPILHINRKKDGLRRCKIRKRLSNKLFAPWTIKANMVA